MTAFSMPVGTDLRAIHDAAFASLRAGDYLAAKIGFMEAQSLQNIQMDMEQSRGSVGRQSIKWRVVDFGSLITHCDKMLAAAAHTSSGPFVMVPVTYARPGTSGDYE